MSLERRGEDQLLLLDAPFGRDLTHMLIPHHRDQLTFGQRRRRALRQLVEEDDRMPVVASP